MQLSSNKPELSWGDFEEQLSLKGKTAIAVHKIEVLQLIVTSSKFCNSASALRNSCRIVTSFKLKKGVGAVA